MAAVAACTAAAGAALAISHEPFVAVVLITGMSILAISYLFVRQRIRERGWADPAALFVLLAALYLGLIPVEIGVTVIVNGAVPNVYPDSFGIEVYATSAAVSLVAILAFVGMSWLLSRRAHVGDSRRILVPPTMVRPWLGLALFATGIAMTIYNLSRLGSLIHVLGTVKAVRLEELGNTRGILPDTSFILAGIAFLWLAHAELKNTGSRRLAWGSLLVYGVIALVLGHRLNVLVAGLVALTIWATVVRPETQRVRRTVVLALMAYLALVAFGHIRNFIPYLVSGKITASETFQGSRAFSMGTFLPNATEFRGPYYSLLDAVANREPLRWGVTYLEAIPGVLPRSLYPGTKPMSLSDAFALKVSDLPAGGQLPIPGQGFSPVAEAMLNFGFVGVALVYGCFAVFCEGLDRLRWQSSRWLLVAAVMMPQVLLIQRTSFSIQGIAFSTLVVGAASWIPVSRDGESVVAA